MAAIYVLMDVAGAGALAVAALGGVIDAAPVRVGLYVLYCALFSRITLVLADLLGLQLLRASLA